MRTHVSPWFCTPCIWPLRAAKSCVGSRQCVLGRLDEALDQLEKLAEAFDLARHRLWTADE